MIFTICGTSATARASSGDEVKPSAKTAAADGTNKQVNEKLRTDILKLVKDTKAGRVTPEPRPQMQSQNSNSLSKRTKIAIAVGVVVAVVAIIVIVKADKAPTGVTIF